MVVLFNRDTPLHDKREMRLSRMVSYTRKLHIFVITLIVEKVEEKERERDYHRLHFSFIYFVYVCIFIYIYYIRFLFTDLFVYWIRLFGFQIFFFLTVLIVCLHF